MADSGNQSPLGINVLGSVLNNTGLTINPVASGYMGSSKTNDSYQFGSIISDTALRLLTFSINDGYNRGPANGNATLSNATYNNLISIGSSSIPALGNSVPPTYVVNDPASVWAGQATSGYGISGNTGQGQSATWLPYDTSNPNMSVTQWGYIRLHALQAWNEFNWNATSVTQSIPDYKEFCSSLITLNGTMNSSNKSITAASNANTFLNGTYSNMNDLISADVSGVNLSTLTFGEDLINLGNAFDLKNIATFGLPSNLLVNLSKNSAITSDLNLALLSAGMSTSEISDIVSGKSANVIASQEQMIYGAFLIIAGENLKTILAALQCKIQGLTTLADLLNVKKLFPTSYSSLTVPIYNGVMGLPTNSKTYYLIYINDGVNPAIDTPIIQSYVGTIIPAGIPPTFSSTLNPSNYNQLPTGFASYLVNIIPYDQALSAGAFSYSMQQIRNIKNCNIQKFAKVVKGIENTSDLPLVAGTSKPTDQTSNDMVISVTALGSGPNGTYTMSDFFGCMSGLPYSWQLIQQRITQLQTAKLYNIYQQMLLAVEWEQATATVQYTTSVIGGTTYYTTTGVIINAPGGGYGRGGAPAPSITISDGSTATCIIDTNDTNAGSNDTGTYGRVTSITFGIAGTPGTTIPTATIQAPPTAALPINSDGSVPTSGTNTASGTSGWATMNTVVQGYIDQANAEITNIQQTNPETSVYLQTYWNTCGSQLLIEQRARYTNLVPVQIPKNNFLNPYPSSLGFFVDSVPSMAQDTGPHMSAQTLEAISDLNTLGGQSLIAMMRQERNQSRLQSVGIDLDNNIPGTLSPSQIKTLITNGTIAGAVTGITSPNGNVYTNPSWATNLQNDVTVGPSPLGIYQPTTGFQPTSSVTTGDITQILNGTSNPVVNSTVPVGPTATIAPPNSVVIIAPPSDQNPTNLPPNLDPNFTNSTLLPASPSVANAIHHVTTCNCDCWIS